MSVDRRSYSRYQVLCAEREAWNDGKTSSDDAYFYDGISFWRIEASGKKRLLPSWRTPAYGWRHSQGCTCELCETRRPVPLRPLSVA